MIIKELEKQLYLGESKNFTFGPGLDTKVWHKEKDETENSDIFRGFHRSSIVRESRTSLLMSSLKSYMNYFNRIIFLVSTKSPTLILYK